MVKCTKSQQKLNEFNTLPSWYMVKSEHTKKRIKVGTEQDIAL